MPASRQLAAIMFTDIVGYTALMGDNEQKAFEILKKNRLVQKPAIESFNGKWIKELGDGVLASFSTVTDAVQCAIEIQKACLVIEGLRLRIGIHLGEVVFEDDDVFGDGVNIASRLQALAPVGGIWISDSVYSNISNNRELKARFVREQPLKNVKEPIRVYEMVIEMEETAFQPVERAEPARVINKKSIAVLPFVNMSNDPEQEYFSDGMAEEILNSLAHIADLKVAGRTSSFQFKGKNIDLREVGDKLGVRTVLEGSVRKHGSRVRITAQLVNVEDGFNLWSERYDREMDDVFAIQDEIAMAITENMKIILLATERELISNTPTENKKAYELYLKGKFEWARRSREGLLKSIDYFNMAIREDDQYTLAYTGMADSYTLLCAYHFLPPGACISLAKKAAARALQLNPLLSEAYEAIGHIELLDGLDWHRAADNYIQAIQLNPGFSTARQRYSLILGNSGKYETALKEINKARNLDPLSRIINTDVGLIHFIIGDYQMAISKCDEVLETDPSFFVALFVQGLAFEQAGNYPAAIRNFNKALELSKSVIVKAALAHAYCKNNDRTAALKIAEALESPAEQEFVSPYCLATIYAGLGDGEMVYHWLSRAVEMKSVWIIHLHFNSDPRFDPYKADPRYDQLVSNIQLLKV